MKEANLKKAVKRGFDSSPESYERFELRYGFFRELSGKIVESITSDPDISMSRDTSMILDVGCGSGISSIPLESLGTVVGLDLSLNMLKKAATRLEYVVWGDAEFLPFQDNAFDLVVFPASIFLIPRVERAFNEAERVVKHNGVVAGSYFVGFYSGERPLEDVSGLRHRDVVSSQRIEKLLNEFQAEITEINFEVSSGFVRDFYLVPAMSGALFPKETYSRRMEKVRNIFKRPELSRERFLFRWRVFKVKIRK
jgi:ubiquinone/menaquinone biosynthesis C-methylase UbiE